MPVNSESRYGKCRVEISGDMTIYTAAELKARFGELLEGEDELELSLAEVAEFDSAGVQLLLWLWREAALARKRVRLTKRSAAVDELLSLYRLATAFAGGQSEPAAGARGA